MLATYSQKVVPTCARKYKSTVCMRTVYSSARCSRVLLKIPLSFQELLGLSTSDGTLDTLTGTCAPGTRMHPQIHSLPPDQWSASAHLIHLHSFKAAALPMR